MAAVPVTFVGMYTNDSGESGSTTLVGMMSITGLGVGGGPIIPPDKPPVDPPSIWPNPPEGIAPHPEHPIVIPPTQPPVLPPEFVPPAAGEPPKPIPPPAGSPGWPVNPIVMPDYVVVNYPGYGPIAVAPPATQ